ncbi:TATA-binding protein-associated factor mot1, partial [Coemansia sp. RSA 2599]
MTTRLDRLVALLDSGATPVVRATAARQIGGIQRQHPEELFRLLSRVYEYIGSKSWDTRIAAAQAIEAIAKEVPEWDPNSDDIKPAADKTEDEEDDIEYLNFGQFNVDSVIRHGRLLLGSAGREYEDDGLEGLNPAQRVAAQRAQMRKRLGIGAEFLGDDLLADEDIAVKSPLANAAAAKRKPEPASEPKAEEAQIDMSKLSARERNRLKRKARLEGSKKKKVDVGTASSAGPSSSSTPASAAGPVVGSAVSVTEQSGDNAAIVVEATRASNREAVFAISAGRWAFSGLAAMLSVDLFDASWEVRHGAGMALREVLKHHGFGAGRAAGFSAEENSRRNQLFLEDLCVRLCCVFALDRFGDFVSDHVVAPVRETCAQALGAASQWAAQALVQSTQAALLQLIARGETGPWEVRHAGLSAMRYVVAVRRDLAPLLAGGALDAALGALRAADDDVRAVAAETLLPLADTLVTCQPHRLLDVVGAAWDALSGSIDDLAAAASAVLALLARLFTHEEVRSAVSAASITDARFSQSVLVPQLYSFLRHALLGVRRAALQTLLAMAKMTGGVCNAILLRLVFQNILLETDNEVRALSRDLWTKLLPDAAQAGLGVDILGSMFAVACTPIGSSLARSLLLDPLPHGVTRHNVDAPMLSQDLGLIPRDMVLRCRVEAAAALGQL